MTDEGSTEYTGPDRRDCSDCISHSKHESEIQTLKRNHEKREEEHADMWRSLETKVNYGNFKWAFGIVVSLVIVVSGINFTTSRMTSSSSADAVSSVVASNHQVELGLVAVQSDLRALTEKLNDNVEINREEHTFFRNAVLVMMKHISDNGGKVAMPMDELNNRYHDDN